MYICAGKPGNARYVEVSGVTLKEMQQCKCHDVRILQLRNILRMA